MHTAKAPHLHAGFQACLTVLPAAFVLETEFIQLTRSCYRSVARLKHLHWLRTERVKLCPLTFKEMISDHFFACTTKMSELGSFKPAPSRLRNPGPINPGPADSHPRGDSII